MVKEKAKIRGRWRILDGGFECDAILVSGKDGAALGIRAMALTVMERR
jgi:hypothetical protein